MSFDGIVFTIAFGGGKFITETLFGGTLLPETFSSVTDTHRRATPTAPRIPSTQGSDIPTTESPSIQTISTSSDSEIARSTSTSLSSAISPSTTTLSPKRHPGTMIPGSLIGVVTAVGVLLMALLSGIWLAKFRRRRLARMDPRSSGQVTSDLVAEDRDNGEDSSTQYGPAHLDDLDENVERRSRLVESDSADPIPTQPSSYCVGEDISESGLSIGARESPPPYSGLSSLSRLSRANSL